MTKYKCPECNNICTEDEMDADYFSGGDDMVDEVWSNWICPKCGYWHFDLDDYEKIEE